MHYQALRAELRTYYFRQSYEDAAAMYQAGKEALDALYRTDMSAYEMKEMQYRWIAAHMRPVLFPHSPFYYETGILPGFSDGARCYHGDRHIGGWTYEKNEHRWVDQDPALWQTRLEQERQLLYLICGYYHDDAQHFQIGYRPVLEKGLRGVYEEAQKALRQAASDKERTFLHAACTGLLALREMGERFAAHARALCASAPENANCRRIAAAAARCPWEKPSSFFEALNVYAFLRKALSSLEGIGVNTFGRLDVDLLPFYEADLQSGRLTEEEAYALIAQFLITFDCHYDHDMPMEGYADHELENTYVLGGCDAAGRPVYHALTRMFLQASAEEKIIYPKIKCRYSAKSPAEYLALCNAPILQGTSTILYQNDDATIPALVRSGKSLTDARDYLVSGCWDVAPNACSGQNAGAYTNLLRVLEYQIHDTRAEQEAAHLHFLPLDGAADFEAVYAITCENIRRLLEERARVLRAGGQIWEQIDPLPAFSALYGDCLQNRRDMTDRGARYQDDVCMCVGFPNLVDALMAIRVLCFDRGQYTLAQLLAAVRADWQGQEEMRHAAMHCPGWGDGEEASCRLASRLHTDLYEMLQKIPSMYGGRMMLGHMTYTEIRFWGEQIRATPDGRRAGDYFAQGLTPSRLKKIPSVTQVIQSLAALDRSQLAGNNVINLILPDSTTPALAEAFLRAAAGSAMESLQLNCVSRDTLLDAQRHPEKYPDLIVRVCGFSARFTSLFPSWQAEVLSRNFYGTAR